MNRFLQIVCLSVIVFSLFACGGGGGGDSTTNPPPVEPPVVVAPNILGDYTLTATKILYSDGTIVTEKDIAVSGHMDIQEKDIVQTMIVNNITFTSDVSYTVNWNADFASGVIHTTTNTGVNRDLAFTYSSTDKSITTYSGVVTSSGVTFEEWDTWTPEIAPTVAKSQMTPADTNKIQQDGFIFVADHLENGGE